MSSDGNTNRPFPTLILLGIVDFCCILIGLELISNGKVLKGIIWIVVGVASGFIGYYWAQIIGRLTYRRAIYSVIAVMLVVSGLWLWNRYLPSPVASQTAHVPQVQPANSVGVKLLTTRRPKELLDFYKGVSPIQGDDLLQPFEGRWITVKGKAETNPVDAGFGASQIILVDDGARCTCTFTPKWRQDVKRIRIDDAVEAQGKVSAANGVTLYLSECELLDSANR